MKTIINKYNKNILGKKPSIRTLTCYCQNKRAYRLNGQCQIGEVVFEATLSFNLPNYKEKSYFEIAEEFFRGRLYNHNLSFRNEFYNSNLGLSKKLWQIKMRNYCPEITWRIIKKCLLVQGHKVKPKTCERMDLFDGIISISPPDCKTNDYYFVPHGHFRKMRQIQNG